MTHEKLSPGAETAARQIIHSWIMYGPKDINHFDPEAFPNGPLKDVAGGVLQAMIHDGVRDLAGLVVWFADAPDGTRAELIECAQGFAPRPTDCQPAIFKLWEYNRQITIEKLSRQITYDLANGGDSGKTVRKLAKVHAEQFKPKMSPVEFAEDTTDYSRDIFEESLPTVRNRIDGLPFRLLGMDDGIMRYMPDNGQHIVSISPAGHTKNNLMQLAPLTAWADVFPSKSGSDWDAATNCLIQMGQSLPRFDPRSIRGRGCWIDGEDVIYHAGDKLTVNGHSRPIPGYASPTAAIYESGLSIIIDTEDAAKNNESARIIELCEALCWDQPLYGKLMAGWIALAPICGAMTWRPHVWVTGASGSGKTWIMGNVVNPLVGRSAVFVQGNTSEAGIRGQLGSDALPVLFDEAEAENIKSACRMESVMELARQASSESGAGIVKGTQSGGSVTYMVRSMFCFSSIGVAAVKKADTSRISALTLRKSDSQEQFAAVKAIWRDTTANPAYCARVRSRAVRNAKTTRKNADTFSHCAVDFTGDKRSADQIGTLLAGAFSLTSTKEITVTAATAWLGRQDWAGFKVDAIDADENQCLAHLMAAPIRIDQHEVITVDEAIQKAEFEIVPGPSSLALCRIGIKIEDESLHIANNHQGLEKVFANTAWAGAKWRGQLLRVNGAEILKNPLRFNAFVVQRAVKIPLKWLK